jgi:hypothetical protein
MKTLIFSILLLPVILTSCAQTRCAAVKKAYAYYTVTIPGMQMADENGNPIPPKSDIARFIYLECSEPKMPEIDSVLYNGIPVNASMSRVEADTVIAGNKYENNQELMITAKKGNTIYKIALHSATDQSPVNTDCKNIILKIKIAGKNCEFKIEEELQLMTLPRY